MDNLHGVLQEIYILVSKVRFSGEYIESLSPAERKLQIFYYEKDLDEQRKQQEKQNKKGGGGIPMFNGGAPKVD